MIRFFVCVCSFMFGCGGSASQRPPLEMRVDFLRSVHPSLERTLTAEDLDRLVAGAQDAQPSHALGAVRALRRVLAGIGDAHLLTELPLPPPGEQSFVPFLVKEVAGVYLVDAAEGGIEVGSKVMSLNGIAIDALMERLALLASVDSARPTVRWAEAERRFAELVRVELGPLARWTVELETRAGETQRRTVPGVSLERMAALEQARRSAPFWGARGQALPTVTAHENFSVLRLLSFPLANREIYLAEVEAIAPELRAATHLAIDLRGNEGGDRSLGVAIARHLIGKRFTQWQRVKARVREIEDRHRDFVTFPVGNPSTLSGFPGTPADGGWVYEGDPLASTMTPAAEEFPGRITLLVDDATNSAAVEFAVALLARHPRVSVVGRETQGECGWHMGQLPVVYGDGAWPAMVVSLFEIELVSYAGCRERRGIEPDQPVEYTQADFDEGVDPYLKRVAR
ncbi:MAG: S41 family peptidase [Myxococcota bacterium]